MLLLQDVYAYFSRAYILQVKSLQFVLLCVQ